MHNFQGVFIIILLCITVVLITGIILPKYISHQIYEFRKELNPQDSDSKYSFQANSVADELTLNDTLGSLSQYLEKRESGHKIYSIPSREKVKYRSKREAVSDEHFTWNFNFNLTGERNQASQESPEIPPGKPHKNNPLDIAIFTGGEGKRKTAFNDIQYSLRAVEYFFKFLFNAENITHEEKTKIELSDSDIEKFDGSGDESPFPKRKAKFFSAELFDIFKFRRSPEKSVPSTISTVPETDSNFNRGELVATEFPKIDTFTEILQGMTNFSAQSLITEHLSVVNKSPSGSDLPGKTEDGECIDCDASSLEYQIAGQAKTEIRSTEFTEEYLEMFCMKLVNKVGVSQHLSDSENLNIGSKLESIDDGVLISSENPGSELLQTSVSGKEFNQFVTENAVIRNDILEPDNEMLQKFLSLSFLGFGSGRESPDDKDLRELSPEKFADVAYLGNLPTLLDCENYFRKKSIKMFPKPNLMDIIRDPEIQLTDIANATISSKLIEQQLQFLTSLIKTNLDNNIDNSGRNSNVTSGNDIATTYEEPKELMVQTKMNDLIKNSKISTSTVTDEGRPTTESRSDGRIFNVFDLFGSGNGESRSLDIDTDNEGFGSGELPLLKISTDEKDFRRGTEKFNSGVVHDVDKNGNLRSGSLRSLGKVISSSGINELGSGDSRLLPTAAFGDNINELGSGAQRALNDLFGSGRNELSSGDLRSIEPTTFGIDINDLGSEGFSSFVDETVGNTGSEFGIGNSRSLNLTSFGFEVNETRSESAFNETSVLLENLRSNSTNKKRFGGLLSLTGSGDGRNLPESYDISESNTKCENCSSEVATEMLYDCDNSKCKKSSVHNEVSGGLNSSISLSEYQNPPTEESVKNTIHVKTDESEEAFNTVTRTVDRYDVTDKNVNAEFQNTIENRPEVTTGRNTVRFLRPIFLTGSGDGGLLGDSGGPIILEEEVAVPSKNLSLRRARLDDDLNFPEVLDESFFNQSGQIHPVKKNTIVEKFTSPVTPSRKRGRIDDTMEMDEREGSKFKKRMNTQVIEEIPLDNKNEVAVTTLSDVNPRNDKVFPDLTRSSLDARSCTAARECNVTLNERCITINSSRVCGCSKGYVRNKETWKCIVKKIVETSIKLPSESFVDELNKPSSTSFQQKQKSSVELMMLLLQYDPELYRVLSEINDVKFSAGSLVITLKLVFAAEDKSEAELVKLVEDDLLTALSDKTLLRRVPLDISEASVISVNGDIDYCKSRQFNYCSEHAYCVSNPVLRSSYACRCKEHYRDASVDPRYFGEICLAKCPKEYCGPYGHCELMANDETVCLCSGLYFGRRCEVPGLYVLIIMGCVGFISLTILLLVVSKRRCSRFSYTESQAQGSEENAIRSHTNGRVSDAIALEENIGTTKFITISTPLPHPAIKIIRPTVTESGSSYDFDSTFDSTPGVHKTDDDTTV